MRVLVTGDVSSVHVTRWIESLSHSCQLVVAGFGCSVPDSSEFVSLGPAKAGDLRFVTAVPRLRQLVRRFRPDLLQAHFVSSYGLLADLASGGRPVVQTAWGSDILLLGKKPRLQQAMVKRALRRAAVIFSDASPVTERVVSLAPMTRLVSVYFGPERSWATAPRADQKRILSPRLLRPLYNVDTIVKAFRTVTPARPEWTLDLLTGGADTQAVLQETDGDAGSLVVWPFISRHELQRRFLEASIFCSVPSSDGTSVALLEGMASGSFPIVSDLAANRRWVTHGENGLVVPPGDVDALASALASAMDDGDLRRRAAAVNRPMIADQASWEGAVETVLNEFHRIRSD